MSDLSHTTSLCDQAIVPYTYSDIFLDSAGWFAPALFHLIPDFLSIIKKSGFRISHKKTHYQTKNPIITGVICQNNRLLAPLGYKKKIAILSKYPIEKSIKNKLQGINAYLSTIKNVNRSL